MKSNNMSNTVKVGCVSIGRSHPIVIQTMCNTHTSDIEASLSQCRRLARAGAEMIRLTVPTPSDVQAIRQIRETLRSEGIMTPIVADIHFSSEIALSVAPFVDKVRINPGNFNRDHAQACLQFGRLIDICREHGTAIRIGINHGSLGRRITELYGNSSLAMAKAAMEWLEMCREHDFDNVVVSLKSSNTVVMVDAYRKLSGMMKDAGMDYPFHVGVTESGNGDSGRIKSCVGISALLAEGIGDTIRVSLTEDPQEELPVASYLARRYDGGVKSSLRSVHTEGRSVTAEYCSDSREQLLLDFACDFGGPLLDRKIDSAMPSGTYRDADGHEVRIDGTPFASYLSDELMQASRRRFYKPEYIACPGCGRTMYNLQETFEEVKRRTSHLKGMVIAVMGCIVNGPGEMADADWGYVGEGAGKVSIYRAGEPVRRHVDESVAIDVLLSMIEGEGQS